MAHIIYRPAPDSDVAMQLIINGIDFSNDVYAEGVELVDMNRYEGEPQVIGLRVTFALTAAEFGGGTPVDVSALAAAVAESRRLCETIRESSERNADAIIRGINAVAANGKRNGRRNA